MQGKRLSVLLLALALTACSVTVTLPLPPVDPPQPPPIDVPAEHTLIFPVFNKAHEPLLEAQGSLVTDLFGTTPCPNSNGVLFCVLSVQTGGAWMEVTAPGYTGQRIRITLPLDDASAPETTLEWAVEPLQRLHVDGKAMKRADGTVFAWQGITAFQLLDDIADGREPKAIALMDWAGAHHVTILRVLAMAHGLFQLDPLAGRAALPRLLDLAAQRGLYVEVVALADTRSYTFDQKAHVTEIGQICSLKVNCAIEIANEPNHATQDSALQSPAYLASLRALIPSSIPVALGANHGPADEKDDYFGGDYVTVHIDRAEGDGGWRWVRHAREIQTQRDAHHHKFVVNDEPDRKVPAPDQHLALGLLMRMYGIGDTVHLGGLRFDDIPAGDELAAFSAREQAWALVPADMSGGRYTAGHLADSPVKVAEAEVLRAYSSLMGDNGYTLLIKVTGESQTQWRRPHTLLVKLGLTQFYSIP